MADKERRHMLLGEMTCQQIDEHVFKHHNFDGLQAQDDLNTIVKADEARRSLRMTSPVWIGMTGVSAYNMTRMGVLSNSGRMGAIAGLTVGAFMTLTTLIM